jgi:voltage-gated potassium channel
LGMMAPEFPPMTDAASPTRTGFAPGYQIFMLALCLYAIGALAARTAVRFNESTTVILDTADYAVCAVFFVDFLWHLKRAENRWRYFATWGWIDLLSSLPMVGAARWGRLARVMRIFRVLRVLRASKRLADAIMHNRAENTAFAAGLVALLLITFCSIAVLNFEDVPGANILTPEDALWWAMTTITTVGYGDRFPVTTEGRVVAAVLMSAGVGLFGTLSAYLAKWFIADEVDDSTTREITALRSEIAALRVVIENSRRPSA